MGLLRLIQIPARHRFFWILLLLLGIVLECCGLYFQYELRLPPCVNCVYERAFYLGFIAAGLIGFLYPGSFLIRNAANLVFMGSSAGGVMTAFEHYNAVNATGFGASCPLKASFPEYLKLDEWLPWMFSPTGSCGRLDWSLFGMSMPEWILLSFFCGLVVSVLFFFSEFAKSKKRRRYDDFYR